MCPDSFSVVTSVESIFIFDRLSEASRGGEAWPMRLQVPKRTVGTGGAGDVVVGITGG